MFDSNFATSCLMSFQSSLPLNFLTVVSHSAWTSADNIAEPGRTSRLWWSTHPAWTNTLFMETLVGIWEVLKTFLCTYQSNTSSACCLTIWKFSLVRRLPHWLSVRTGSFSGTDSGWPLRILPFSSRRARASLSISSGVETEGKLVANMWRLQTRREN